MASIGLEHVTKRFADQTVAVRDFGLAVADGELMVLVGPSGCGKSTILRMVAGLEDPTAGAITIAGRVANDIPPGDRDIAMVFQDYALYPHMSVYDNLAFALKPRRRHRVDIDATVRQTATALGIEELLSRRPRALSGGERQRVALGRAIVRRPSAFLMDEPLSNLDAKLRVEMRAELRRIHDNLGATFLYVTHDQVEAMTLGDQVAVIERGVLQQVDTPRRLYEDPANAFVARFIGSPPMNLVMATVEAGNDCLTARFGPWVLPVPQIPVRVGARVLVGVRPEDFSDPGVGRPMTTAQVRRVLIDIAEPLGGTCLLHFGVGGAVGQSRSPDLRAVPDAPVEDCASSISDVVASVDGRSTATAGQVIDLALDAREVFVFECSSGRRLHGLPTSSEDHPSGERSLSQEEHQ